MKLERRLLVELPPESDAVIADADLAADGRLLALLRHPDGRRECLFAGTGRSLPLPADADYVRAMPEDRLLVIGIRTNRRNGAVLRPDGTLEAVFDLDAPICDALVDMSDGTFWVSYFRMGAPVGLAGEGLVRFDARGTPSVRFRSDFAGPESAGETHPFCLGEDTTLWLCPEPDFQLLQIDWSRWSLRSRRVPWECQDADALCVRPPAAYFAATRRHPHLILAMDLKSGRTVEAGSLRGRPRPVTKGPGVFLDIQRREVGLLRIPGRCA